MTLNETSDALLLPVKPVRMTTWGRALLLAVSVEVFPMDQVAIVITDEVIKQAAILIAAVTVTLGVVLFLLLLEGGIRS